MTSLTNCLYKSIYNVCSYGNSRDIRDRDWIYYCLAALGTLTLEFKHMCNTRFNSLYASGVVHYYGLNPTEISSEQAEFVPLLLIHGKWHNQGVWFSIARTFQEKGIKNPLFSINVEDSEMPTSRDYEIIEKKFDEIKQLYASHTKTALKISLCGYSRGGLVAYYFAQGPYCIPRDDVDRVMMIGAPPMPSVNGSLEKKVYRITAKFDLMIPLNPICTYINGEIMLPVGHLELPYSRECHSTIAELIQS